MKQLVSILIPAFNAQNWIRDCIESALAQTWSWKEIIVVDDGSRDATFETARSYASPNVQVTSQENRGASAARNQALSLAQGDYIQWLDADDLLAQNKIARQLEDAEHGRTSRVLLSGSWGRFYNHPERSRFRPTSLWRDLQPVEWLLRKVKRNEWMAIESWLVSRKLTDLTGPWNEELTLNDDGEYFCRVVSACTEIRFISDAKCFCRGGNVESLSYAMNLKEEKLKSQFQALRFIIQSLRFLEDSPRTQAACLMLLEKWAGYFHQKIPEMYREMECLAIELGGELLAPLPDFKLKLMSKLVGPRNALRVQRTVCLGRITLKKVAEKLLFY